MNQLPRLYPALAETVVLARRAFWGVAFFSLFINLLLLTTPIYMLQVFERVLASENIDTLVMLSLIAGAALLAMALLEGVRGLYLNRLGVWVEEHLGGATLEASVHDALRPDRDPSSQGLRDLATIRGFLSGPSMVPLMDAPWVPLYLVVMFLLHPWLGGLAVAGAFVLFALAVINEMTTRDLQMKAGAAAVAAGTRAEAAVRNAEAASSMGMVDDLVGAWRTANAPAINLQGRASGRIAMLAALSKFFRLGLQVAVLGLGALLVVGGEFGPGAMIAGSIILSRALAPVEHSISAWRGLLGARGAYMRLKDLFSRMPERADAMTLPRPEGRLLGEGLAYTLPGRAEPILRNINFDLEPGQCLAVMGPSASGKTTLARLLVGVLKPSMGAVRLDGMDVFAWESSDLGPHVGYLPQDVELFAGSVSANIARMAEPDPDTVVTAAKAAGVHDMVMRMDKGYDTDIGPGGAALSGGQRQRIGLARAVYGNPRFLVLDEPNANLDKEGEEALHATLKAARADGATVVAISHRPSILKAADKILILEAGTVRAYGSGRDVRRSMGHAKSDEKSASAAETQSNDEAPTPARKLKVVASQGPAVPSGRKGN